MVDRKRSAGREGGSKATGEEVTGSLRTRQDLVKKGRTKSVIDIIKK